ncbi:hypothetical protein LSTR_LSTR012041 [Laodelphax striatellus]|uniref:Uncharacterized protein n=1 Tax=Laodelphax striatellus TaxID=195883 RepID=A0A482WQF8_LAOST|nr:hypothetical protein LSTR_LSTR012041 [Laodelphax striatellus]
MNIIRVAASGEGVGQGKGLCLSGGDRVRPLKRCEGTGESLPSSAAVGFSLKLERAYHSVKWSSLGFAPHRTALLSSALSCAK